MTSNPPTANAAQAPTSPAPTPRRNPAAPPVKVGNAIVVPVPMMACVGFTVRVTPLMTREVALVTAGTVSGVPSTVMTGGGLDGAVVGSGGGSTGVSEDSSGGGGRLSIGGDGGLVGEKFGTSGVVITVTTTLVVAVTVDVVNATVDCGRVADCVAVIVAAEVTAVTVSQNGTGFEKVGWYSCEGSSVTVV